MLWFIISIFLVISIVLLMGKGAFFIAGYNTASDEEKAQYHEKKLCRIIGLGFLIITLGLWSLVFNESWGLYIMIASIMIGLVVILVGSEMAKVSYRFNQNKRSLVVRIVLSLTMGGFIYCIMFSGNIHIEFQKSSLALSGSFVSSSLIDYQDIIQIEYREDLKIGKMKNGINNAKIEAGRYHNDEFGNYRLYSYTNSLSYVVIETENDLFVVSGSTKQQTQDIYRKLNALQNK